MGNASRLRFIKDVENPKKNVALTMGELKKKVKRGIKKLKSPIKGGEPATAAGTKKMLEKVDKS